jgi:HD superfamily phosphodiesterase
MEFPKTFEELLTQAPQEVRDMIEGLKELRERPDYHPEPNAYEHVKIVTERLMLTGDPDLIMAGLFHDITKKIDAKINPKSGWPTSPGHDRGGARVARKHSDFVQSIGANIDNVFEICEQHMRIKQIDDMRPSKQKALRDLSNWKKLEIFTLADNMLSEFSV